VQSFRVLDAAEDEIANVERAFLDVAIMVASDTLRYLADWTRAAQQASSSPSISTRLLSSDMPSSY
jgi:hypothetical protein